jgi:NifU-like protein
VAFFDKQFSGEKKQNKQSSEVFSRLEIVLEREEYRFMWEYTDKVKEHFWKPRNVGELENPDGFGEVGSIACGDALRLTFRLDENKRIKEAKFKSFGCASAIAAASVLTEMLEGLTIEEAEGITNQDIAASLGGLPEQKMHCSVLGAQVLEKAIAYYRGTPLGTREGQIICECFGVTDQEIEKAVRENHLTSVEEVANYTKAGGGCGNCHEKIQEVIDWVEVRKAVRLKLINIQSIRMIEENLERKIEKI